MRVELSLLILLSVLLSSGSQVLLNFGMSAPDIQVALAHSDRPLRIAISIVSSLPVFAGLASFGLSAIVWLFVLSKIPVSTAYPFVALGIAHRRIRFSNFLERPSLLPRPSELF
jgi:hypothetical protein